MSGSKALANYFNSFMISRPLGNIAVFSSDTVHKKLLASPSSIIYGSGFFFIIALAFLGLIQIHRLFLRSL